LVKLYLFILASILNRMLACTILENLFHYCGHNVEKNGVGGQFKSYWSNAFSLSHDKKGERKQTGNFYDVSQHH